MPFAKQEIQKEDESGGDTEVMVGRLHLSSLHGLCRQQLCDEERGNHTLICDGRLSLSELRMALFPQRPPQKKKERKQASKPPLEKLSSKTKWSVWL